MNRVISAATIIAMAGALVACDGEIKDPTAGLYGYSINDHTPTQILGSWRAVEGHDCAVAFVDSMIEFYCAVGPSGVTNYRVNYQRIVGDKTIVIQKAFSPEIGIVHIVDADTLDTASDMLGGFARFKRCRLASVIECASKPLSEVVKGVAGKPAPSPETEPPSTSEIGEIDAPSGTTETDAAK